MKKFARKKATAVMMAATMMVTMTGCGKKSDGGKASGDQAKADTKTMVYEGEEFKLDGIEGDPYSYNVHGDKLYMLTYEWKEPEGFFAFCIKDLRDGHTGICFDLRVHLKIDKTVLPAEKTRGRALPGPHKTNQKYMSAVHCLFPPVN